MTTKIPKCITGWTKANQILAAIEQRCGFCTPGQDIQYLPVKNTSTWRKIGYMGKDCGTIERLDMIAEFDAQLARGVALIHVRADWANV